MCLWQPLHQSGGVIDYPPVKLWINRWQTVSSRPLSIKLTIRQRLQSLSRDVIEGCGRSSHRTSISRLNCLKAIVAAIMDGHPITWRIAAAARPN